jgi:hypothetical protein
MFTQRTFLGGAVLVAAGALITGQVVSQVASRDAAGGDPCEPSAHHEILNRIAGRWEHDVSIRRSPGAEAEKVQMTADYRWMLGGRFLRGTYTGYIGGEYFEARDLVGYDNLRGQYESLWVDNESTAFTLGTGRYDERQNALILEGTQDNAETGAMDEPFRFVYRFGDERSMTIEVWVPGPDGTMFKRVEAKASRIP